MKDEITNSINQKPLGTCEPRGSEEILLDNKLDFKNILASNIKKLANKDEPNSFPMEGMPEILADLINNGVEVYGSPLEYFACSLLVACGSVVRKRAVLDDGKYKNYPQLWIMLIGSSGIGKDAPLKIAFKPILDMDELSYKQYQVEIEEWRVADAKAKKDKTDSPHKPILKMILIDDATPESFYPCLQQNGGLTLHRDELSGWFADFGRYSKNGEVQRYLSLFTNGTFSINRVGKDHIKISDPFYSIIGGIQPEILPKTLNENQMKENGFVQRFLFAYPDKAIQPYYNENIPNPVFALRYKRLIEHLHTSEFGIITLSEPAKQLYITFVNEMVAERNSTSNGYQQALFSRFRMHVLRIALTVEIVKSYPYGLNEDKTISIDTMQYAIDICRYFIVCGLKVEALGNQLSDSKGIDPKQFAKTLLKKGYTQTEIAKITDLSQPTLSRLFSAKQ